MADSNEIQNVKDRLDELNHHLENFKSGVDDILAMIGNSEYETSDLIEILKSQVENLQFEIQDLFEENKLFCRL